MNDTKKLVKEVTRCTEYMLQRKDVSRNLEVNPFSLDSQAEDDELKLSRLKRYCLETDRRV